MLTDPRRLVVALALFAGLGCAKEPEAETPPPAVPVEKKFDPDAPITSIHRAHLEAVLEMGPPWVLSRVEMDEVLEKDKFVGWRIRELPPEWKGVDLQPGDVVTAVNTMPLETPNDFWAAWTTLSVASELKVSYLRDSEERQLRLPIEGNPDPKLSQKLKDKPKQKQGRSGQPQRKKTVVIQDNDRPISDTVVDW